MCDQIDHIAKGLDWLITQYRESPNMRGILSAYLTQSNATEDMFCEMFDNRWIDTAVKDQLDIIGIIVGQSRIIEEFDALPFFGFQGALNAGSFGTIADSGIGERFRGLDEQSLIGGILDDPTYRKFIRAKIKKNHVEFVSVNEVLEVVGILVDNPLITLTKGLMTINLDFQGTLSASDRLILSRGDLIPRVAGSDITFSDDDGPFS
ncbi:MAG: hypothetical protein DRJ03_03190 [Chloroflexi bacterium]|nr:MAG: hypothetical protein DRJ03_03190 [Chloroflexota bacterium]